MSVRVVISVLLAFLAFAVYSWYTTKKGSVDPFMDLNSQTYEQVPVYHEPPPPYEPAVITSSGPNAPNQRPPENPPTIAPQEVAFDPQENTHESAEIPERLRHPERSFSPGLLNEDTETAVAAGTASYASQMTTNAAQVFGPEFAQNGGNFMDGIMANDSTMNTDYSSL